MLRPALNTLLTRRMFPVVGIAGIVLLAAFAGWAGMIMTSAAQEVRRSTELSDAFQRARYAAAEEALTARAYQLAPDPMLRTDLQRSRLALEESLSVAIAKGSPHDQAVARRVLQMNVQALATIDRLFDAVNRADAARVAVIDKASLRPLLGAEQDMLDAAGATHRAQAVASLRSSQRSERVMVVMTLVSLALGVLLVFAVGKVVGVREQLESARQAELDRLRTAALTDNLTGLRNHRAFQEDLDEALGAATSSAPLSLVLVDLDGLKQTNDRYGHQAGDECLVGLAQALRRTAGKLDTAYRIGGDEFALLIPEARAVPVLNDLQRMQSVLGQTASGNRISATVGIAEALTPCDRDELIRAADVALISAKRNRRQGVVYSPALEPEISPASTSTRHQADVLATALARAVDAKDAYTHSHCETVSELCALIGQELGLDPERIADLRLAGLLHDVGKIGIPDRILQKPERLTAEEFEVMKRHSQLGHEIVVAAERPVEAEWILHHHERLDGTGYPAGLAGEQIPLESRVVLVADAFEAITADRPYRQHSSIEQAMAELRQHAGTQFDPRCVEALRRVIAGDVRKAA